MKTLKLMPFLAMLFMLNVASTCSHDDHDDHHGGRDDDHSHSAIAKTAVQGNWKVATFENSGTTKTDDFSGYAFTFSPNGTLQANNAVNTFNGSWLATTNDTGVDFGIVFPTGLRELSGHWNIISHTATKIELIQENAGGEANFLTFQKN